VWFVKCCLNCAQEQRAAAAAQRTRERDGSRRTRPTERAWGTRGDQKETTRWRTSRPGGRDGTGKIDYLLLLHYDEFFTLSTVCSTRGHKYKLYKSRRCSRVRHMFFVERVINIWNSLPPSVNFKSLATFRRSVCCVDFSNFLQYS